MDGGQKRLWTWLCVVLTLVGCRHQVQAAANALPHIIFIVADDLGWNDVGWRDPNMHTPNLNKMAANGIILNNSYVQPLCSPSRSAWMSGYFPFHTGLQHGVIGPEQQVGLPANLSTMPDELKKLGYATHAIGKWHLGFCNWKYTPTYRGFDSWMGYYNGAEDYYTHIVGPGLDFRKNKDVDRQDTGTYSAYLYADRAEEILSSHNKSQPLFLYLPFQSVHEPLQVPQQYEDLCSKTKNSTRRTKCGMVAILDEAIGNITQLLEMEGYTDNMLLVFTTDNGGPVWWAGNNWPLRGAKATMWEGGTRGTGFVYSKNLISRPGTVHEGLMHAVDWMPTFLSVVGAHPPPGIDGVSQWESLVKGTPSPRTEFVYNMDTLPEFHAAIRDGDWKLIQGNAGSWDGWYPVPGVDTDPILPQQGPTPGPHDFQLYNVRVDPTEHQEISSQNPDVLAKMKNKMAEWRKTMIPPNFPPPDPASDPKHYGGVWSPGWC